MTASKPYLRSIDPSPARTSAAMEWAHYLGSTFGTSGALEALRYYENIDWISAAVRRDMIRYVQGLSHAEIHNKKYDEPETLTGPLESLSGSPFGVHARSLTYVAELAGVDLEGQVMLARMAEHRAAQRQTGPGAAGMAPHGR